jgi:hypothetical protein
MFLMAVPASVEISSPEKEPDDSRVLLTIELQNAILALEAKQPDTSIGELFSCIFFSPDNKLVMNSEILSRAALASHLGYGEESLRNNVVIPPELLENR